MGETPLNATENFPKSSKTFYNCLKLSQNCFKLSGTSKCYWGPFKKWQTHLQVS